MQRINRRAAESQESKAKRACVLRNASFHDKIKEVVSDRPVISAGDKSKRNGKEATGYTGNG